MLSWLAEHEKTCDEEAWEMLAAACNVTVPMATAEIWLDFFRAVEGEADGGGIGGGLTGTTAAAACSLSSLRAASLPLQIRAMCSSSSVCSAVETACHFLPGAGERVVGLDRFRHWQEFRRTRRSAPRN